MDKTLVEKTLSRERLFSGKIINVERWEVELPNGKLAQREVVLHPGAAAVVAIDEQGNVALVEQYRCALGALKLEIPAGKLDAGEEPMLCAARELQEETGYIAENLEFLTAMDSAPGFCSEQVSIYLARGLRRGEMHLDEDEFLMVSFVPMEQVLQQIMSGSLNDAKSVCGILMAARILGY